jgi:hypothetical protein
MQMIGDTAPPDRHLYTLQVLSAHMKLLLDAPEHLWRLIERKKYFQAAWLFLLARVVHKALIRNDEQDELSWMNEGIDVLVCNMSNSLSFICSYRSVGRIPIGTTSMGSGFTVSIPDHSQIYSILAGSVVILRGEFIARILPAFILNMVSRILVLF